jgi:hypothetical protein
MTGSVFREKFIVTKAVNKCPDFNEPDDSFQYSLKSAI